jgi:hypothetical protein
MKPSPSRIASRYLKAALPWGAAQTETPPSGSNYDLIAVDWRSKNPTKLLSSVTPEDAMGMIRKLDRLFDYWKNKYDSSAGEEYQRILGMTGDFRHPYRDGVEFLLVRGRGKKSEKWYHWKGEWVDFL